MKMKHKLLSSQSGIASLFVVVFFTILISIIVISFVQIVNQDQEQALNNDLSSSAYDSAKAGVEDAKRGLELYYRDCVRSSAPNPTTCSSTDIGGVYKGPQGALVGGACNEFHRRLGNELKLRTVSSTSSEVKVSTSGDDDDLSQSYTCLKVNLYTRDYKAQLANGTSTLVPIKTRGGTAPTSLRLNWFEKTQEITNQTGILPSSTGNFSLPRNSQSWGSQRPPLMKVQVVAVPKTNFSIDEINDNSKSAFLYPSTNGSETIDLSAADATKYSEKNSPTAARCSTSPVGSRYVCGVTLTNLVAGNPSDYDFYVRLKPLYNGGSVQLIAYNGSDSLTFDGVNPEVDSTGRANDVYRRVVTRVAYRGVESGVDVTQGICKTFQIADNTGDYYAPGACTNSELY